MCVCMCVSECVCVCVCVYVCVCIDMHQYNTTTWDYKCTIYSTAGFTRSLTVLVLFGTCLCMRNDHTEIGTAQNFACALIRIHLHVCNSFLHSCYLGLVQREAATVDRLHLVCWQLLQPITHNCQALRTTYMQGYVQQ